MRTAVIALCLSACALSGCTTSLTHESLTAGSQPNKPGVSYYLPRQRYVISVAYQLLSCPNANGASIEEQQADWRVKQTATVTESPIADLNQHYAIPLNTLTSGMKTTSLTVALYDNGTLKSVGATVDDQTGAVIGSLVSTGVNIATTALTGVPTGAATPPSICTDDVYAALKTVKESPAKLIDPATDDKTRANIAAAVVAANAVLTITKTYIFDPYTEKTGDSFSLVAKETAQWIKDPARISASDPPQIKAYNASITTYAAVSENPPSPATEPTNYKGQGILFREAVPVTISVCATDCSTETAVKLAVVRSTAPQFGRFVVLPLKNRPFEKNNLSVSFAANGAVDTMTYGTESRIQKMAAALATTTESVNAFADKKKASDQAAAGKVATAETDGIKADTALINAKADNLEAKQRLAKLTGTTE